jgi:hypothetical protein
MSNIVINGTTITGDLDHDEQIGVQHDGSDDDVASVSSALDTYTTGETINPADGFPGFATTLITGFNPAVQNFSLTSAADGTAFSTTVGIVSGRYTADGQQISLFGSADGNAVIGRAANGDLAFIIYLDETVVNNKVTAAKLNFVQYLPLLHTNANAVDSADTVDFANLVYLSSVGSITTTSFENLLNAPSGQNQYMILTPDSGGSSQAILITGMSDGTNTGRVNTSGSGIAVENNSINAPETLRVDFIKAPVLGTDTKTANTVDYGGHIEDITGASFRLTQVQAGDSAVNVTLRVYNEQGDQEKGDFASDAIANPGDAKVIQTLEVTNGTTVLERWEFNGTTYVNTIDSASIGVTGLGSTTLNLSGLKLNDKVTFTTASGDTFDRFTVTNIETSGDKFDLGGISLQKIDTTSIGSTVEIGSHVVVEDDGPTLSAVITGADTAQVDETSLSGGAVSDTADLDTNFTVGYGADGAGSLTFKLGVKLAGVDSGLTDTESGEKVLLYSVDDTHVEGRTATGNVKVISFALADATKAEVTFTQFRAVVHTDTTTNNDATPALAADLLTLTGTAADIEGDKAQAATLNIGGLFTILDDGPSITTSGSVTGLHVDESFIPTIGSGDSSGLYDQNTDSASFAGIFGATYGADKAGSIGNFVLGIGAGITDSGLDDSATGLNVLVKLDGTKVVGYIDDAGTERKVFEITVDSDGNVSLTQLRAVHQSDGTKPDGSEGISMAAGVITLSATATDKEGDKDTGTANIGDKFTFHDDGPTAGAQKAFEVDFTADAAQADHLTGTIGGVEGADTAAVTLTGFTSLAGFTPNKVGNTVTYSKDGADWFRFTIDEDGNYDFSVLRTGTATNETFNFGSVKPGAPVETATVKSAFGHAIGVFDGVIFTGAGANNYTNSPTKNVDDINADKLGFGIMGSSANQASQINNNEGFLVKLDQATDTFQFDMQGIGNNAKGVHVEYTAYNDLNNNGKVDAGELVATNVGNVSQSVIKSGSETTLFKIDAASDFTNVNVRFYFDSTDLQNGALSGNTLRQAIDNAGIRVLNVGAKQVDTIPEYDLKFDVTRTDKEGDYATTSVGVHVDPDHTGVPTDITGTFNWLIT